MRRLIAVSVAILLGILFLPARASAQIDTGAAERDFRSRINALRASKGLSTLIVHDELTAVARSWAGSMARADRISHNPRLSAVVQADWEKLGENVGVGMTVEKLHNAFVASPSHYRNLVESDFGFIGVGVVAGRDGSMFTAHTFMQLRPGASPPPRTRAPAVSPPVTAAPAEAEPPLADAASPGLAAILPVGAPARLVLVLHLLRELDGS